MVSLSSELDTRYWNDLLDVPSQEKCDFFEVSFLKASLELRLIDLKQGDFVIKVKGVGRGGEETLKPKRQKLTNTFYVAVRMFNKRLQITLRELYRPTVTWDLFVL